MKCSIALQLNLTVYFISFDYHQHFHHFEHPLIPGVLCFVFVDVATIGCCCCCAEKDIQ